MPDAGTALATPGPGTPQKPKLLVQVRNALRLRHYSDCTEKAYVQWIRRYIFFNGVRHPAELGKQHVAAFLSYLARERHVAASTQNQALCALIFLYQSVLGLDVGIIEGIVRAKRPLRLPVVLTPEEIRELFRYLEGEVLLLCRILYGSGMRLMEGLRMRVKDLDFARHEITVRSGKGEKDRVTMLPASCDDALRAHLERVRALHRSDLAAGLGRAPLPYALARKYQEADREWGWQYVFPASSHYQDRITGAAHRHHLHESVIQREVKAAARHAGLTKPTTPHAFRHSFATEFDPRRPRHPHRPGTPRPCGHQHHDDLRPRPEPRRPRRPEPRRPPVTHPTKGRLDNMSSLQPAVHQAQSSPRLTPTSANNFKPCYPDRGPRYPDRIIGVGRMQHDHRGTTKPSGSGCPAVS